MIKIIEHDPYGWGDMSAPEDSVDYAVAIRHKAQTHLDLLDKGPAQVYIETLLIYSCHLRLKDRDGNLFTNWKSFVETDRPHGLGLNMKELQWIVDGSKTVDEIAKNAKPMKKQGRPENDGKGADGTFNDSPTIRGSNNAKYLTARIARDHPEIHERMKAGEFKSVRQAAMKAGIVKPEKRYTGTPIERAKKALKDCSDQDQQEFFKWLKEIIDA